MLAAGLVLYSTSGSAEHLSDIYLSHWGKKTIRWDPQADVKTTLMTCEKSLLSPSPQSASHKKITLNLFCRALRHPPWQRRRWLIKVMVERNPSILFPLFPPFLHSSLPPFIPLLQKENPFDFWGGRETENISLGFQTKAGFFQNATASSARWQTHSALNWSDRVGESSLELCCGHNLWR